MSNIMRGIPSDTGLRPNELAAIERNKAVMAPRYDAHVVEYERYDPIFLAMGVAVPKAKPKHHHSTTAAQRENWKRNGPYAHGGGRTLNQIKAEQSRMDRAWAWGRVMRG